MEVKEIIRELLDDTVSEEQINTIIREVVDEKCDYNVREQIRQVAHDVLREKTYEYVQEMVNAELAKPVKTNDGWGGVEYYDSFEDLVRQELRKNIRNSWELKRYAENIVKNMIELTAKNLVKQFTEEEMSEKLIKALADNADSKIRR